MNYIPSSPESRVIQNAKKSLRHAPGRNLKIKKAKVIRLAFSSRSETRTSWILAKLYLYLGSLSFHQYHNNDDDDDTFNIFKVQTETTFACDEIFRCLLLSIAFTLCGLFNK